uniref:Secreted protein n=1 Tax=Zea mays TaxID=4577 RepID=A0A804ML36_MAIZE
MALAVAIAAATAAAATGWPTEAAVALLSGSPGGASCGSGSVMVVPMGEPTGAASSSSMALSATGPSAPSKDPSGLCAMGVRMLGLVSASSGVESVGENAAAPVRMTRSRTTARDTAMVRAPYVAVREDCSVCSGRG